MKYRFLAGLMRAASIAAIMIVLNAVPVRGYIIDGFANDGETGFPAANTKGYLAVDLPLEYPGIGHGTAGVNRIPEPSTMLLLLMGLLGSTITYLRKRYYESRRMLDIVLSVAAIVVTFPVLLIAAVLIKLDSPGPVFYRQVRVGINRRSRKKGLPPSAEKRKDDTLGQPFTIYKLRTMACNAEAATGPVWARKNDTRITKIGLFLRKTRIDEIPQFINVLRGEMSIVGPRPERPVFVKELNENIRYYWRRFNVKPGITGLAQVRYQYVDSIKDTRKKLKYDLLYVKKMCLFMDVRILFNTVRTILFARGAR